ncbi:MAG: ATP-dependent zinc protease [Gammaproteobacteria bacterium]|nr:ATP-dependent zinc protease [Gammaproteobacteria bacterium]
MLGGIEHARIEPPGLQLRARLDTGAAGSSLHALDVRAFERDGKTWVKFQLVDTGTGKASKSRVRSCAPSRRRMPPVRSATSSVSRSRLPVSRSSPSSHSPTAPRLPTPC